MTAVRSSVALALAVLSGTVGGDVACGASTEPFSLVSSAFSQQGEMPSRHTCEGEDISPPLSWFNPPEGTKTFALIVDDPDAPDPSAPTMTWVHWVLYNLPATMRELPDGVLPEALPAGTKEGSNDWKRTGYGGPCPPIGRHRYVHKLYALDTSCRTWDQQQSRPLSGRWRDTCLHASS
jgi:Raf kinase inhibitor-like YbhB/YbcL family protein